MKAPKRRQWIRELFDAQGHFNDQRMTFWPRQHLALLLNYAHVRKVLEPYGTIFLADAWDLPNHPERGMELIIFCLEPEEALDLSIQLSELLETRVYAYAVSEDNMDALAKRLVHAYPLDDILIHWHLDEQYATRH